ncbi:protein kinase domain-containing protein [Synechocystis salina]|uniref:non-specific serine/threonine protein kinase n=1 Tax=Synechocystis salina LEGE 00031 TaxID=1828736 RepID=A0ABR9VRM0_9SYNC|nr:protein kinase [Synechocystis salina]MBE9240620.1 protein kinase [Synechocystis salina LEGE 00041]MBE9253980.1 protein kinase [Synechocystis salina LEGE 00031]
MNAQLLNRYEIVRSLGSGGFGETFLAKDTQIPSQKLVVVKRLKPATASSNTSTELIQKLFEKESSVLEDLGEHNGQIPKLYSYFSTNDEFYLVQEYIQGVSLSEIAPINSEQAKTILSSLLTTLKYIHSKGIIHRDIKPENIILRDSDHLPVLIDFGAVKETMGAVSLSSGSTVSSVVIGTRGFMAPEQSAGRSVFSTDLYALGLTIIYALTKKLPVEFATSQLTGELDWQSHVPDINQQLTGVLNKAIQMEPSRRYPTADAMYQDLHSLASFGAETVPPMETVRVTPSNEFLTSNSSSFNSATRVSTPISSEKSSEKSKSKIATLLTILIGIIVVSAGLGGGFVITQQIKEAEARAAQAEKEKQEAEQKRIEAEQKIAEEEKRQKELEAQRIEQERQQLTAEANRAKQERQRLAAERQRVQALANQARAMAGGASATIGGIPGSKNIRSGPGTNYGVVTQGYTGDGLDILDSSTDSGGHVWYKVYHYGSGATGWMASQLVNF